MSLAEPCLLRDDRALVNAFIRRHYGLTGAVRLHRHALGWDLMRAPVNVALAPLNLTLGLFALALRRIGARRAARRLGGCLIHLPSDVGRAVARALAREVLAPRGDAGRLPPAAHRAIDSYLSVRTAVAEITATLAVLSVGAVIFGALTPGVFSLTPLVAEQAAGRIAVESFPLGAGLGRIWYGLFEPDQPAWLVAGCLIVLLFSATVLSAFAGVLADPVQRATGIHRRRLMRLLARIDAARAGEDAPGIEREHVMARFADITDAVASAVRYFRV